MFLDRARNALTGLVERGRAAYEAGKELAGQAADALLKTAPIPPPLSDTSTVSFLQANSGRTTAPDATRQKVSTGEQASSTTSANSKTMAPVSAAPQNRPRFIPTEPEDKDISERLREPTLLEKTAELVNNTAIRFTDAVRHTATRSTTTVASPSVTPEQSPLLRKVITLTNNARITEEISKQLLTLHKDCKNDAKCISYSATTLAKKSNRKCWPKSKYLYSFTPPD